MKKLILFSRKLRIVFCAGTVALVLIFLCFVNFRLQIDSFVEADMRSQIEAIQRNSVLLIQNEMNYLKRQTASALLILSREKIQTDEDILKILEDYSDTSGIVRTLFITLDGHAYTSYAGYLGKSDENTSIDGIPLSEIREPIFSQPYYSEDLDEVIFGVLAPVTMGEKQGILVSSYNIKEFSSLLITGFVDGTAEISIVNSKGEVVSGSSVDQFGLNIFESLKNGVKFESLSAETMQTDFANGESGFSIYCHNGITRYCAYAPVGLNDWYAVVLVKEGVLRSKLAEPERYGFWLTVELVIIMLGLLCVIIANRVSEQKRIQRILEQAAMMDGLTGIYNRRAIEELVDRELGAAGKSACAALLIIDVDDFKKANDQGGHLFGDNVLRSCAKRLTDSFKEEGIVGRIGGDEFVVFLRDGRDLERIEDKVNGIIRGFYVLTDSGKKQKISISVGIAQAETKAENSFLRLYQMADAALYRAKHTGKARISN